MTTLPSVPSMTEEEIEWVSDDLDISVDPFMLDVEILETFVLGDDAVHDVTEFLSQLNEVHDVTKVNHTSSDSRPPPEEDVEEHHHVAASSSISPLSSFVGPDEPTDAPIPLHHHVRSPSFGTNNSCDGIVMGVQECHATPSARTACRTAAASTKVQYIMNDFSSSSTKTGLPAAMTSLESMDHQLGTEEDTNIRQGITNPSHDIFSPSQARPEVPAGRLVPTLRDVCLGLVDYPGTNEWRNQVAIQAARTSHQGCWSNAICEEVKRQLPGRRFLVCENNEWRIATDREILQRTRQRFRDARKPKSNRKRGRPRRGGGQTIVRSSNNNSSVMMQGGPPPIMTNRINSMEMLKKILQVEIAICQNAVNISAHQQKATVEI